MTSNDRGRERSRLESPGRCRFHHVDTEPHGGSCHCSFGALRLCGEVKHGILGFETKTGGSFFDRKTPQVGSIGW